ncbi:MAG: T9SS type A sorting domain-containing protein [Candidatus Kapaibacteriales bacterium]
MKKTILLLSSLFLIVELSAQITTWEKQYGKTTKSELAWDIAEDGSGNFVVTGVTMDSGCVAMICNTNGWVVKINSIGDTIWTKSFDGTWLDIITSVIVKGTDYVMTGIGNYGIYGKQAWFLKIDANGNLLTDKNFGGNGDDSGDEIISTVDGGFFIIGSTKSFGTQDGKNDVWLLKLDSNGDTIWTKTYNLGNDDMGTSIIPFQNNKFLISAVTCTANCGGLNQQGFATYFIIDSAGTILSTKTFNQGQKNKFYAINPTSDGGAIIIGATSLIENFPSEDIYIVKLNSIGDTLWTKIIGDYNRYDGGFSIYQTNDDGYYVAAYSQSLQTPQMDFVNWWLLRLNSLGDTLWTRWWGGADNDDPYSIIPTSVGGLIMAGFRDANSNPFSSLSIANSDFYVIKTDSMGTTTGLRNILPKSSNQLIIYPNPFSTQTVLQTGNLLHDATLTVYNYFGQTVAQIKNINAQTITFLRGNLASGLYFIRLTEENKTIAVDKLVITDK